MAAAADRNILLKQIRRKGRVVGYYSICSKKSKFERTSEYLLTCWKCLIVNADS
jgi:hypothetical protein